MKKFGELKSKIVKKLSEAYSVEDKKTIKDILTIINKDKKFKETYLFYEQVENLEISYPGSAELYVENIELLLNNQISEIQETCKKLNNLVGDVKVEDNELYNNLDILSENKTLNNLDKRIDAKKKFIEFLKTKKETKTPISESFTTNESLLLSVMTNNFNVLYNNTLSEEDKKEFKSILSLNEGQIVDETKKLKENIFNKIEQLLHKSTDSEFNNKLNSVKNEVTKTDPTKYGFLKLKQLEKGLD